MSALAGLNRDSSMSVANQLEGCRHRFASDVVVEPPVVPPLADRHGDGPVAARKSGMALYSEVLRGDAERG